MANEGSTKPTEEPFVTLSYGGTFTAKNVEDALRGANAELDAAKLELARVRGLLQRQWISAEERLPDEKYDLVLVATNDGFIHMASWEPQNTDKKGWSWWVSDEDGWMMDEAFTHWQPLPDPPTFPQSPALVPQGAESADIGKLDAADKAVPSCSIVGKTWHSELYESGVEMGKVNRVEEIWKACRAAAQEVLWSNISPEELDRAHVQEDITDQANVILKHIQPLVAGSAETGGERRHE